VQSFDYLPLHGTPDHRVFVDEREKYPQDELYKATELFAAPATRRHFENFLAARRSRQRPVADIEEGHISSACCILANLSMELGRSLVWDSAAGRVVDDDAANRRLTRDYRGDWIHPTPTNV
jgi:hypothetical protein